MFSKWAKFSYLCHPWIPISKNIQYFLKKKTKFYVLPPLKKKPATPLSTIYQSEENNLTIHENGQVVGGGTTGQSLGPAGSGSAGTSGGNQNAGNTGSDSKKEKIICTEMYRQTQLDDWQRTIKLWYLFQQRHCGHDWTIFVFHEKRGHSRRFW